MTYKDIIITPIYREDGVVNEYSYVISMFFNIFDSNIFSLSADEQREKVKNISKIKYSLENRPNYISKLLSSYSLLLYLAINEKTINSILSTFWLVDENQNITMGVCTDWQFDLFCKDFDVTIRNVQERVIKTNLTFNDERDNYTDIVFNKNHHKKLVELKADLLEIRIKNPKTIDSSMDIDLINNEIKCLEDLIKTNSPMIQDPKENFKLYTKELDSYEYEIVDYDRHKQVVYDDTTFKPIQLFRLPKYNQFETEYERLIDTLAKDAYEEICFWDIESKKNALKLLQEKKLRFKDYWEFEHKYHNLINEHSKDFDYVRFILSFFSLFDIKVKNEDFTTNDGFLGNYGLVTVEVIYDLHDALMNKQASLDWLIKRLENHLGLSLLKQPSAEQKGFDLGLTEEQLKALHQQLIDEKFLDKNTKLNHFINAFNGEVLKDFKRLEWLKSVFGAIFLKVNFDTDSKKLKVWQNAEKIFDNGNATSLRNADKGTDKHKDYFKKLSEIIKSLP